MRRIGVDTGGTFTDCVLIDDEARTMAVAKVPSQPKHPDRAVLNGILKLLDETGLPASDIDAVYHGTTIATNAVIMDRYVRGGFIGTRGCRDVLEIGTQMRPDLYDLQQREKSAIIERDRRVEVPGRIAADGTEIEALDLDAAKEAAKRLVDDGVQAFAVGGLFSFVNNAHESAIAAMLREEFPDIYVAHSAQISPEPREYPRFATTAINATLAPLLDPYISNLENSLRDEGLSCPLYIMQSNGGTGTAARSVGEQAHQLVLSGPAAGVIGAIFAAEPMGMKNLVTLDVGGTSADIGIVVDSRPRVRHDMPLPNGIPLTLLNLEIETIGAGGGSIAWVDAGGALRVGPISAGADPGPVCFGKGGTEPTVTDAQVLLGRLNPQGLLGGDLSVDRGAAGEAFSNIAETLDLSVEKAALGVVAVMEADMAGAIRQCAARHGDDLRDFTLVAAGGAGALNAVALAKTLGIPRVLVPKRPGLLSATGLLAAKLRHDLSLPLIMFADEPDLAAIEAAQDDLEKRTLEVLETDGIPAERRRVEFALDLRYLGQEFAVTVPCEKGEAIEKVLERFHETHERVYGHSSVDDRAEIVAARIIGWGLFDAPRVETQEGDEVTAEPETREVWFDEAGGYVATPIYKRHALKPGTTISGPAIVEQLDTTTVLLPGYGAKIDASENMVISEESAA
ncbi:hydantoinase/oxoprolinase family protein [Methyloligella sp. 2.7D]|uniref:hydantoinase/oxoprolinase family protein n=1 Tax=unclassified Methyloligella TaxID=2625955 RepID=UPI00157C779C|nr:hydantoinase/oxoprolinase family protein [Methyloligella sp. GL2]QKP76001.1 hydantoinase/oxoprolinase family protein [Methyloligella sp. GL2]